MFKWIKQLLGVEPAGKTAPISVDVGNLPVETAAEYVAEVKEQKTKRPRTKKVSDTVAATEPTAKGKTRRTARSTTTQ